MAVELGVAYLSIIPSFKNMNSSIKSAMGPVESEMAAAGQRGGIAAGGTFSKGMASGVSSSSGAMTGAMNTVGTQTTTAAGVHGKNAGTSLGQKMMTGFLAVGVAGMVVGSIKGARVMLLWRFPSEATDKRRADSAPSEERCIWASRSRARGS